MLPKNVANRVGTVNAKLRRVQRRHGFTLIEMLVVVGLMSILLGIAAIALQGQRREGRVRGSVYRVRALVSEARSSGLSLGTANNTNRIDEVFNCPADFGGGGAPARAGLLINATAQTLTYIHRIVADDDSPATTFPPRFDVFCTTVDLATELRNSIQIDAAAAEFQMPAGLAANTFFIPFSSRGFIDQVLPGPVPGVVRIVLRSNQPPIRRQVVLIMGSGMSCLEGRTPGSCARTDE